MEEEKRYMTKKEKKRLNILKQESEDVLDLLAKDPTNSWLVSRLNEIDIKIITITHETLMDY